LAIVPALIVTSGGERFAIPQVNLLELIRIDEAQQNTRIEYIHGTPVYRLRGKLLPIVYLNKELGLNDADTTGTNMVVLQAEQRQFGLVVDQVNDSQEIVVKPLAEALKDIPVFAGATIMGDGRVALILDILGIAQRAHVLSKDRKHSAGNERQTQQRRDTKWQTILIVRSPGNGRLAIPLNRVARLEEFSPNQVESSGDVDVIQYRGGILPLIPMDDVLEERRSHQRLVHDESDVKASDCIHVVVFGNDEQNVGLVVEEVLDIVEEAIEIKGRANRCGILGTAVIQERVTELFDVEGFLKQALARLLDSVAMEV
jgi:two-component system chemotaxis sensor kinase CheA